MLLFLGVFCVIVNSLDLRATHCRFLWAGKTIILDQCIDKCLDKCITKCPKVSKRTVLSVGGWLFCKCSIFLKFVVVVVG